MKRLFWQEIEPEALIEEAMEAVSGPDTPEPEVHVEEVELVKSAVPDPEPAPVRAAPAKPAGTWRNRLSCLDLIS